MAIQDCYKGTGPKGPITTEYVWWIVAVHPQSDKFVIGVRQHILTKSKDVLKQPQFTINENNYSLEDNCDTVTTRTYTALAVLWKQFWKEYNKRDIFDNTMDLSSNYLRFGKYIIFL